MKSSFDANVSRRKPKTRLGTMLADLPAPAAEDGELEASAKPTPQAPKKRARKRRAANRTAEPEATASVAEEASPPVYAVDAVAEPEASAPAPPAPQIVGAPPAPQIVVAPPEVPERPAARSAPAPVAVPPAQAPAEERPAAPPPSAIEVPTAVTEVAATPPHSTSAAWVEPVRIPSAVNHPPAPEPAAKAAPPASEPLTPPSPPEPRAGDDAVEQARARLARLRAKLDSSAQRFQASPPEATATRVKETVGSLRTRLEDGESERRRLLQALSEAERAKAEADKARQAADDARQRAEGLAEERAEVAQAALTESEALAEERDSALARAAALHDLTQQQASLLEDMEQRLQAQADTLKSSVCQSDALRAALDAAQADVDAALRQVDDLARQKKSLAERVDELKADLAAAHQAKNALAEIQKLVDGVD